MKIRTWSYQPFTLKINRNLPTHRLAYQQAPATKKAKTPTGLNREGVLISLTFSDGSRGYGELSPLDGVHSESLKECLVQLIELMKTYGQQALINTPDFKKPFFNLLPIDDFFAIFPSVQFAIESALSHLVLDYHSPTTYDAAGLIFLDQPDSFENGLSSISKWHQQGCRHLKIKIGTLSKKQLICAFQKLSRHLPNSWKIRIDGLKFNEDLTEKDFFLVEDIASKVEFLEESSYIPKNLPFAVDESLWDCPPPLSTKLTALPEEIRKAQWLVLKPSRLGGFSQVFRWAQLAHQNGIGCLLSSCFDTNLSFIHYCRWAKELKMHHGMGCGTHAYTRNDPLPINANIPGSGKLIPTQALAPLDSWFALRGPVP